MPELTSERKKPKRSKIRYAEYYDLQKTLDSLYADSSNGKVFTHLMELISSKENIRMAYRLWSFLRQMGKKAYPTVRARRIWNVWGIMQKT